jgi:dUTP pyrophosphatase
MYQTRQSAGLDLAATESYILLPGDRALIDTGVYLKDVLPDAVKAQLNPNVVLCGMVCPRSGLAAKYGLTVLNAPGIIDLDYPDTIKVCLVNHGEETVCLDAGTRIAQLVFSASYRRSELVKDEVRTGGHGSTGT